MKEKKDINIQIGERIQKARILSGYTQERFAEIAELTPQFVSDLERGVTGISLQTFKRICEVLNISSDAILFGTERVQDISDFDARLKNVPEEYLKILEVIINKYLEAVAIKRKEPFRDI